MNNREKLRWLAFDHHGIVTTDQAVAAGVPAVELRKLAARGALSRVGFGVYRMEEAPTTPLTPTRRPSPSSGPAPCWPTNPFSHCTSSRSSTRERSR